MNDHAPFQVDGILVLPALNRIRREGDTIQVEPRVMKVLLCLARRPGEVLSREALFAEVWPDAVVCEEALTRTISELRRLFRDDSRDPRIIETIRKSGYRLVATVAAPSPSRAEAPDPVPPVDPGGSSDALVDGPASPESGARNGYAVPTEPFLVADWLAEPALARLSRNGRVVRVEPRVMQVLACLATRPGRVFSRTALTRAVWNGEDVRETTLTSAISDLRRVFEDAPEEPRYIETIRGAGYRLLAPVRPAPGNGSRGGALFDRRRPRPRRAAVAAVSIALVLAGTVTAFLVRDRGPRGLGASGWRVRPLTTYPGTENTPALSPDGTMLAFSWDGGHPDSPTSLDLHVMHVDQGTPVRLTSGIGYEIYPAWSPDGTTIAYVRETPDSAEIRTVKVLGGGHRTLLTSPSRIGGLDWSPDGATLAYSAPGDSGTSLRIHLLELETLRSVPVDLPALHGNQSSPRFSPDGRELAFVHSVNYDQQSIFTTRLGSGEVRELRGVGPHVAGIEWTSPRELVFAASNLVDYDLWLADLDSDRRTWLTMSGRPSISPTVAHGGERLVFGELSYECNIFRVACGPGRQVELPEQPIVVSTRLDYNPVCSPDGGSIAFLSDRTGRVEVWIAGADGEDPRQLTDGVGASLMSPCWSPDGSRVAYSALRDGRLSLFVSDVDTKVARPLAPAASHELLVHWSAAGDWLYSRVQRGDHWELWRRHGDGTGEERVAERGHTVLGETDDGDLLCWRDDAAGIWRLPAGGGEATLVVPGDVARAWTGAAPAEGGLFFIRRGVTAGCLGFHDWATAREDSLGEVPLDSGMLVVSPDGRHLLYDSTTRIEIDLMLADAVP